MYPKTTKKLNEEDYTAGNEGVAQIVETGNCKSKFKVGDWVIPSKPGFGILLIQQNPKCFYKGTWRTSANVEEEDILKLPSENLSLTQAATISVNPCTAYRMLNDYIDLEKGFIFLLRTKMDLNFIKMIALFKTVLIALLVKM